MGRIKMKQVEGFGTIALNPAIDDFLMNCRLRNLSPKTIHYYEEDLRYFAQNVSIHNKYPNVVPIPGSKNKKRILENLGADQVQFSDEEFAALETALAGCTIYGHRGHVEEEGKGFLNKKPLR